VLNREPLQHVKMELGGEWIDVHVGDKVEIDDGIYLGSSGAAVVFDGKLVAAWKGKNHIIPHGSPRDWDRISSQPTHIDNLVAHIPLSSLKEGARRENLNWEEDCAPRINVLVDLLSRQIEPIHLCMMACSKMRSQIKEGVI